jgi:hypothetical protein
MSGARRMAAVLRIRELQERLARAEVGAAQAAAARARSAEDGAWTAVRSRRDGAPTIASATALLVSRDRMAAGITVAHQAGAATVAASATVDDRLAAWRVTAQRVDGLERLTAELARRDAVESERRASSELDDLVLARRAHRRPEELR